MSSGRDFQAPASVDEHAITKLLQHAADMFAREAARLSAGSAAPGGVLPSAETLPGPVAPPNLGAPASPPTIAAPTTFGAVEPDRLRRQATDFVESLLAAVSASSPKREDQAPLLRCIAPAAAGESAQATFRLANDGTEASDVSLYSTNFVADTGYDIPSLRVTVSPRRATIAPRGEVTFAIVIAIPAQTPRGAYSGLLQATGAHYAKAVLTVDVT
jgi:hypothetical protein